VRAPGFDLRFMARAAASCCDDSTSTGGERTRPN